MSELREPLTEITPRQTERHRSMLTRLGELKTARALALVASLTAGVAACGTEKTPTQPPSKSTAVSSPGKSTTPVTTNKTPSSKSTSPPAVVAYKPNLTDMRLDYAITQTLPHGKTTHAREVLAYLGKDISYRETGTLNGSSKSLYIVYESGTVTACPGAEACVQMPGKLGQALINTMTDRFLTPLAPQGMDPYPDVKRTPLPNKIFAGVLANCAYYDGAAEGVSGETCVAADGGFLVYNTNSSQGATYKLTSIREAVPADFPAN